MVPRNRFSYSPHFELSEQISTRDRDAINKTLSGLVKANFPSQDATETELEELLAVGIEVRKRVKDQSMRIDQTNANVHFAYVRSGGEDTLVKTLEEETCPTVYYKDIAAKCRARNEFGAPLRVVDC